MSDRGKMKRVEIFEAKCRVIAVNEHFGLQCNVFCGKAGTFYDQTSHGAEGCIVHLYTNAFLSISQSVELIEFGLNSLFICEFKLFMCSSDIVV